MFLRLQARYPPFIVLPDRMSTPLCSQKQTFVSPSGTSPSYPTSDYLAIRKEEGLKIDPSTAEVNWM